MKKVHYLSPILFFVIALSCLLSCKDNSSQNREEEIYPETEASAPDETMPEDNKVRDSMDKSEPDSVTVGPTSPKKQS